MFLPRVLLAFVGAILVSAAPHAGMSNLPGQTSSGLAFENTNYQGASVEFIELDQNACLTFDSSAARADHRVYSVQICKPATCALFGSRDCSAPNHRGPGSHNFAALATGPVDVSSLPSGFAGRIGSYLCGVNATAQGPFDMTIGSNGQFATNHDMPMDVTIQPPCGEGCQVECGRTAVCCSTHCPF